MGAIVAIVVFSLLAVFLTWCLLWYCFRYKRREKADRMRATQNHAGRAIEWAEDDRL